MNRTSTHFRRTVLLSTALVSGLLAVSGVQAVAAPVYQLTLRMIDRNGPWRPRTLELRSM